MKIAYWVFCAFDYNRKFDNLTLGEIFINRFPNFEPNANTNNIRVWKIMQIQIQIYLVWKNYLITNTNSLKISYSCTLCCFFSLNSESFPAHLVGGSILCLGVATSIFFTSFPSLFLTMPTASWLGGTYLKKSRDSVFVDCETNWDKTDLAFIASTDWWWPC